MSNNIDDIIEKGIIGKTKLTNLIQTEGVYSSNSLTVASKNIKKIIKDMYPELLMVKVKSERFSGGDSINISIIHEDSLSNEEKLEYSKKRKEIDEIISIFSDKGFDGMTDSSYSRRNPINEKYGNASYVSLSVRSYYDDEEKESYMKKKINEEKKQLNKLLKKSPPKEKNRTKRL